MACVAPLLDLHSSLASAARSLANADLAQHDEERLKVGRGLPVARHRRLIRGHRQVFRVCGLVDWQTIHKSWWWLAAGAVDVLDDSHLTGATGDWAHPNRPSDRYNPDRLSRLPAKPALLHHVVLLQPLAVFAFYRFRR